MTGCCKSVILGGMRLRHRPDLSSEEMVLRSLLATFLLAASLLASHWHSKPASIFFSGWAVGLSTISLVRMIQARMPK